MRNLGTIRHFPRAALGVHTQRTRRDHPLPPIAPLAAIGSVYTLCPENSVKKKRGEGP